MPLKHNFDRDEETDAQRSVGIIEVGRVMEAPNHTLGEQNKHVVRVNVSGAEDWADVGVNSHGDINLPQPGTEVLVAIIPGGKWMVVDTYYTAEESLSSYESGERRLTHALTDSNIYFDAQGHLTLENDTGQSVTLTATSIDIDANGGVVNLDGGGSPVARQGDPVEVTLSDGSTGTGQITDGSNSVESG